jgi:EAL domain-containing protein (putative c-di-GMP-specific phosphodiesterase class I)
MHAEGLSLQYQPIVSAVSGRLVAAEALLRLGEGRAAPVRLLRKAAKEGESERLDRLVVASACAQLRAWDAAGLHVPVHVNVSTETAVLTDARRFVAWLSRLSVNHHRLTIEVTETNRVRAVGALVAFVEACREAGFEVALDDFGCGYSTLALLQHFRADVVKIDRRFVEALADDAWTRSIVQHMIALAHDLGMRVIGEGVETPEQAEWLVRLGADELQGYAIARPMRGDDLADWAAARERPGTPRRVAFGSLGVTLCRVKIACRERQHVRRALANARVDAVPPDHEPRDRFGDSERVRVPGEVRVDLSSERLRLPFDRPDERGRLAAHPDDVDLVLPVGRPPRADVDRVEPVLGDETAREDSCELLEHRADVIVQTRKDDLIDELLAEPAIDAARVGLHEPEPKTEVRISHGERAAPRIAALGDGNRLLQQFQLFEPRKDALVGDARFLQDVVAPGRAVRHRAERTVRGGRVSEVGVKDEARRLHQRARRIGEEPQEVLAHALARVPLAQIERRAAEDRVHDDAVGGRQRRDELPGFAIRERTERDPLGEALVERCGAGLEIGHERLRRAAEDQHDPGRPAARVPPALHDRGKSGRRFAQIRELVEDDQQTLPCALLGKVVECRFPPREGVPRRE